MAENYMSDVAQILGLKLGERFQVYDPEYDTVQNWCEYMLTKDGVVQCWLNPSELPKEGATVVDLNCLICGGFEVVKLPEFPKEGDLYWTTSFYSDGKPFVEKFIWNGVSFDFSKKALGMIYRTREEAEAHMSDDYQRLTGKPLSSH